MKTALVTGGAGAMGAAVAAALLEDGLRVVLADLDGDAVAATARGLGADVPHIAFDVGDHAAVAQAVTEIAEQHGAIDVLVNNAGVLSTNRTQETTPEEWQRVMRINADGAFYLSRAVLPGMVAAGWGRIVNTTSMGAKSGGLAAGPAYCASKGALIALTFSLALEAAPHGVTVNGIAPAFVKTAMMQRQLSEQQQRDLAARIPVRRLCEPAEFAHVVRFLVSPLAGFITGEIIDQNGGMHFD